MYKRQHHGLRLMFSPDAGFYVVPVPEPRGQGCPWDVGPQEGGDDVYLCEAFAGLTSVVSVSIPAWEQLCRGVLKTELQFHSSFYHAGDGG